jgi:hypothetical protein
MYIKKRLTGERPSLFKIWRNYENPGQIGEYLIDYVINKKIKGYYKTLRNVYLNNDNETTEIDEIILHEKGIFIIESKNYSGWIFGNEKDKTWTQCLRGNNKNKFYNPILQNNKHIKEFLKIIPVNKKAIKSIIVFADRCTFKKMPYNTDDYTITKRYYLIEILKYQIEESNINIEKEAIDKIYKRLLPYTNVSDEIKQNHIQKIKNKG